MNSHWLNRYLLPGKDGEIMKEMGLESTEKLIEQGNKVDGTLLKVPMVQALNERHHMDIIAEQIAEIEDYHGMLMARLALVEKSMNKAANEQSRKDAESMQNTILANMEILNAGIESGRSFIKSLEFLKEERGY